MKLQFCALVGALIAFSLQAQDQPFVSTSNDPVVAQEEAQRQAQFAFENQLADLNNSANQAKEGLLSRRNALNRELQQCFIQKNQADIDAQQNSDQKMQQATNQMIQGAQQGLTPIFQNLGQANGMGKKEAVAQREAAVKAQHVAARDFMTACPGQGNARIDNEGKNATTIISKARRASLQQAQPAGAAAHATTGMSCQNAAVMLMDATEEAQSKIKEEKQVQATATSNTMAMVMGAAALGINYYGYNQAKEGAESGLADTNRMNNMSYDACQQGVRDEAAEIDRQLANVDRQLAADRDRLAKQFAMFKLNMPPNMQNKGGLPVDDGDDPIIGGLGGSVAAANLKGPSNPFDKLNQNGGGGAGGAGAGAGGGATAGGGDDGKVGWGFRDPYETNNPGLAYTLPNQPEKAGLVGGADGDGGGGGAGNPFGDGFMGFEDPFGNLAGAGGAALAEGQGGNGFIELALKTRRRVYAHLNELLGKPSGTKISKDAEKNPERKISSVRD